MPVSTVSGSNQGRSVPPPVNLPPAPVAPTITTTNPPDAIQNTAYSYPLAATGTAPITWSVPSGALPSGITLNASTGLLSGTPTVIGTSTFTIRATNATGSQTTANIDIVTAAAVTRGPIYFWSNQVFLDAMLGAGFSGVSMQTFKDHGFDGHIISLGSPSTPFPAWQRSELASCATYGDLFLGINLADLATTRGVPQNQTEWNQKIALVDAVITEAVLAGAKAFAFDPEPYVATENHGTCWNKAGLPASLFRNNGQTMGAHLVAAGLGDQIQFYLSSDSSWHNSSESDVQAAAGRPNYYVDSGFPDFVHGLIDAGCRPALIDAAFQGSVQTPGCSGDIFCAVPKVVTGVTNEFGTTADAGIMMWPDFNEGGSPHQLSGANITNYVRAAVTLSTGGINIYTHPETFFGGHAPYPPPGTDGPTYWRDTVLPAILAGIPTPPTPVVNAKTFAGAAFDGVTNDTVAVQSAATAAAGGTLYFPGGFTTRVGEIIIPDNTIVTGDGATSVLKPPTWGDVLKYDAVFNCGNNVTITNLKIDGNGTANLPPAWSDGYNDAGSNPGMLYTRNPATIGVGRGYRCGIRAQGVTGVTVSSCEFTNLAGAGVATIGTNGIYVLNCNHHDTQFELLYAYASVTPYVHAPAISNITVSACFLTNIHAPAGAVASGVNPDSIVISRGQNILVQYNTMTGIDRDFVKMESPTTFEVMYNTISDGTSAPDYPAIQVSPWFTHHEDHSIHGKIHHNTISGPGFFNGIQVNSDDTLANVAQDIEIYNNSIDLSAGSGLFGIQCDGNAGLTQLNIHDNDITGTSSFAIYVYGGGTNLILNNNRHTGVTMTNVNIPGAFPSATHTYN